MGDPSLRLKNGSVRDDAASSVLILELDGVRGSMPFKDYS
jgi:hypothetical protein